jgi:hypothetical protein
LREAEVVRAQGPEWDIQQRDFQEESDQTLVELAPRQVS